MPGMAVTVGNLNVKLSADGSAFQRAMGGARNTVGRFGGNVATVGVKVAKLTSLIGGLAAAGVALAAGGSLKNIAESQLASLDATAKFANRIGIAADRLAGLRHAAEQTGVSSGQLDTALQRMTRRVAEAAIGAGEARGALAELGLDAGRLAAMTPDQQFHAVADAMGGVANQGDRVRLAMRLFDTEGVGLVNTLKVGADGLRQYQAEAERLGIALSDVQLDGVEDANDAIDRMRKSFGGAAGVLVAELSPAIVSAADRVTEFVTEGDRVQRWAADAALRVREFAGTVVRGGMAVRQFVRENEGLLVTGGKVIAGVAILNRLLPIMGGGVKAATVAWRAYAVAANAAAMSGTANATSIRAVGGATLAAIAGTGSLNLATGTYAARAAAGSLAAGKFGASLTFAGTAATKLAAGIGTVALRAAGLAAAVAGYTMLAQAAMRARDANISLRGAIQEVIDESAALGAIQGLLVSDLDANLARQEVMAERSLNLTAQEARLRRELGEAADLKSRAKIQEDLADNLARQADLAGRMRDLWEGWQQLPVEAMTANGVKAVEFLADKAREESDALQAKLAEASAATVEPSGFDPASLQAAIDKAMAAEAAVTVSAATAGASIFNGMADAFANVRDEIDKLTRDPIELAVERLDIPDLGVDLKGLGFDLGDAMGKGVREAYGALLQERDDLKSVGSLVEPERTAADVAGDQIDALERLLASGRIDEEQFDTALERLESSLADGSPKEESPAGPSSRESGAIGSRGQDAAAIAQQQIRLARGAAATPATTDERQLAAAKDQKRVLDRIEKLQAQVLAVLRGEGLEEVRV